MKININGHIVELSVDEYVDFLFKMQALEELSGGNGGEEEIVLEGDYIPEKQTNYITINGGTCIIYNFSNNQLQLR